MLDMSATIVQCHIYIKSNGNNGSGNHHWWW